MLKAFDVIRIHDGTTTPPKPRMVVCIHYENGWYYRITSKKWLPCLQLLKIDHPFLDHDSFLECGQPLELSDYEIQNAMNKFGKIGHINDKTKALIITFIQKYPMKISDKNAILSFLI
jgi:hypothetical protein